MAIKVQSWYCCHFMCLGSGGRRDGDNEDLANENKYKGDRLALLQKEGGENSVFGTFCSTFEDNFGDRYDWEDDSITQHYLCRLLYTHYNHHVRGCPLINSLYFDLSPPTCRSMTGLCVSGKSTCHKWSVWKGPRICFNSVEKRKRYRRDVTLCLANFMCITLF